MATEGGPRGGGSFGYVTGYAVWDGREMLVLARVRGSYEGTDLYRYDPVGDRWTPAAPVPLDAFRPTLALWTGDVLLTVGDQCCTRGRFSTLVGAAWSRATERWTVLSSEGSPSGRVLAAVAWSGSTLYIWGGDSLPGFGRMDGGIYDLATDQWSALPGENAPGGRYGPVGAWPGRHFLVWGGYTGDGRVNVPQYDGGAYDPGTNSWRTIPPTPLAVPYRWGSAVWAGDRLLVWGGRDPQGNLFFTGSPINEGLSYLPPC